MVGNPSQHVLIAEAGDLCLPKTRSANPTRERRGDHVTISADGWDRESPAGALLASFKPWTGLVLENLALRHQLTVLRRTRPRRIRLCAVDRLLFVWLYRLWPGVLEAMAIVRPETVLRWHRDGFRAYWRWKSRSRPGRPRVPREVRDLIRQMSLANRLWGAPRIHGELLKLGRRGRPVHRGEVHGQAPTTADAELGSLPAQSCRRHCWD